MKHFTNPAFWDCYDHLSRDIQLLADKNFALLKANPKHPSLHLKKVGNYWSARIGKKHRALAIQSEERLIWFWIGTHAEYDELLK